MGIVENFIVVFNPGSSGIKFAWFDSDLKKLSSQKVPSIEEAVKIALKNKTPSAVGHRVVHGGTKFDRAVRIDAKAKTEIKKLSELAPLHNPVSLKLIEAVEKKLPNTPQYAVFDTSFYHELPPKAYIYPLPYKWYEDWGIRRFGFHGINHQYCMIRAAEIVGKPVRQLNMISCHLGNGCSATAIKKGKPIVTTMGFSPLEGLMMGTRSGSVDPGILTYVERRRHITPKRFEEILNHESGLLGVSGISSDFPKVEKAANSGNKRARLALDIFIDRIKTAIGGLYALLGETDILIFTGGIGENSQWLRNQICNSLSHLNIKKTLVIPANEEWEIARQLAMSGSAC